MSLTISEAVSRAEEKFSVQLSLTRATALVHSVRTKYARMSFVEALRFSLNDMNVSGEVRSAYRSMLGSYFGSRGGKKQKSKKSPDTRIKTSTSVVGELYTEVNGQRAFRV